MLKINIGTETRPVVEDINEYNNSIFKHQYEKAFQIISEIIGEKSQEIIGSEVNSNIVAFCGDRGSGKTSCMESVTNFLNQYERTTDNKNFPQKLSSLYNKNKGFEILKTIDPSFFDENHNIIQIIVGSLFLQFKEEDKKRRRDTENGQIERIQIINSFSKLHACLHYLDAKSAQKEYCKDDIEQLELLSNGIDLKDKIKDLINNYLAYVGKDFLVIQIDDIDLNVSHAYEMAEQIRKYLILPKVIILIAVKPEQLIKVVEQHLAEKFRGLFNMEGIDMSEILSMADKYVEKLLPVGSRVVMPMADVYFDEEFIIGDTKKDNTKSVVKNGILDLINSKTGLRFFNSKGEVSMAIPTNLRSLCHLVKYLYNLPEPKNDDPSVINRNRNDFSSFFIHQKMDQLSAEYSKAFEIVYITKDITKLNKTAVTVTGNLLRNIIKQSSRTVDISQSIENGEIIDILNLQNNKFNISMGDVFALLNYLEKIDGSFDSQLYAFLIRTLYTINLLNTNNKNGNSEDTTIRNSVDQYNNLSTYQKILGGGMYTLVENEILQADFPKRNPEIWEARDVRLINGDKLNEKINELTKNIYGENLDYTSQMTIVELFILSTSRYLDIKNVKDKNEKGTRKYRVQLFPFYFKELKGSKNVIFDVLHPFFSICNINNAYLRFGESVPSYFEMNKDSLYNKLKCCEDASLFNNTELICDLYYHLCSNRNTPKASSLSHIIRLYGDISNYFKEKGIFEDAEKCWATIIYNELKKLGNKANAGSYFDEIFNSNIDEKQKNKISKSSLNKIVTKELLSTPDLLVKELLNNLPQLFKKISKSEVHDILSKTGSKKEFVENIVKIYNSK